MPGIYIAAVLTIVLALMPVGLVMVTGLRRSERLLAVAGMLGSGAAFWGAYYLLRLPLDRLLRSLLEDAPGWYRFGTTLYAPLTEEPAKWVVLVPFYLMGAIRSENKGAWAMCLGFGFGIAEIAFLAQHIGADPQTLLIPWYRSSGFIVERWMVCFLHSALVLIAADALSRKKVTGMLLAPVLHWLINIPIFLSRQFPLDDRGVVWGQLLGLWTTSFFVAALFYLGRQFPISPEWTARLLGTAMCPECQTIYVRPWWGVNRVGKRYERCPHCRHFHWTTRHVQDSRP